MPSDSPTTTTAQDESHLTDLLVKAALQDPRLSDPSFDCSRVFALISVLLATPSSPRKHLIRSMKTVYVFHVTNAQDEEAAWWVDMKKKGRVGKVEKGGKAPLKPDVSIWVGDRDLVGLATGALNPQKLYAAKRLRVRGNLDSALNVEKILTHERQKLERLAPIKNANKEREGRWLGVRGPAKAKL